MQQIKPYSKLELQREWTSKRIVPVPGQIAIVSKSGAGSSTLLRRLRTSLGGNGTQFFSGGDLFRARAKRLKFPTIEAFVNHVLTHPEEKHDEWLDNEISRLARKHKHLVFEGRLPHILMPWALTVYLDCYVQIRADRRRKQLRRYDEVVVDHPGALKLILQRDSADEERNSDHYPGCDWSKRDFDLVLDTRFLSPEQVEAKVLEAYYARKDRGGFR